MAEASILGSFDQPIVLIPIATSPAATHSAIDLDRPKVVLSQSLRGLVQDIFLFLGVR